MSRGLKEAPVTASPGFFLLLLLAALYFQSTKLVVLTVLASAVHEGAHFIALRLCGARVKLLRLTVFGAEMVVENPGSLSYGQEICCAAAGPAGNLLFAVLLGLWGRYAGQEAAYTSAGIHTVQALFNLLPFQRSDGGRILYHLLAWWISPDTAEKVSCVAGVVCGGAVAALSVWVVKETGGNGFLLLGAMGLFMPLKEKVLVKKRKAV